MNSFISAENSFLRPSPRLRLALESFLPKNKDARKSIHEICPPHPDPTSAIPTGWLFPSKSEQDGRLAPAYFSQEYKYFDQYLPAVKNETIV